MISQDVATRLLALRKAKKITREKLSAKCAALGWPDLTVGALGSIETGRPDIDGKRRRQVTVDELVVLAKALHVEVWDLCPVLGPDSPKADEMLALEAGTAIISLMKILKRE